MKLRDTITEKTMLDVSAAIEKEGKKIEKMTDRNDHSGAAIYAAQVMDKISGGKFKKFVKLFQGIDALHKIEGSLPRELSDYRYRLLNEFWKEIPKHVDKVYADKIIGAF